MTGKEGSLKNNSAFVWTLKRPVYVIVISYIYWIFFLIPSDFIEEIKKIALMKKDSMTVNSLKAAIKNIIGSCGSLGVLIEGKFPKDINKEVDEGEYDSLIKAEKTEMDESKKALLKQQLEVVQEKLRIEQEKLKALEEAEKVVVEKPAAVEEKVEEKAGEVKEEGKEVKEPVAKKDIAKKEEPKKEKK